MDLDTIKRHNVSFIDESLQVTESDIVFSVNMCDGTNAYIYTLIEH